MMVDKHAVQAHCRAAVRCRRSSIAPTTSSASRTIARAPCYRHFIVATRRADDPVLALGVDAPRRRAARRGDAAARRPPGGAVDAMFDLLAVHARNQELQVRLEPAAPRRSTSSTSRRIASRPSSAGRGAGRERAAGRAAARRSSTRRRSGWRRWARRLLGRAVMSVSFIVHGAVWPDALTVGRLREQLLGGGARRADSRGARGRRTRRAARPPPSTAPPRMRSGDVLVVLEPWVTPRRRDARRVRARSAATGRGRVERLRRCRPRRATGRRPAVPDDLLQSLATPQPRRSRRASDARRADRSGRSRAPRSRRRAVSTNASARSAISRISTRGSNRRCR